MEGRESQGESAQGLDYLYAELMFEILDQVVLYAESAKGVETNDPRMGVYLKMASRAMRNALELYGERIAHLSR